MVDSEKTKPINTKIKNRSWIVVGSILLGVVVAACALYFLWLKPLLSSPMNDPLDETKETEETSETLSAEQELEKSQEVSSDPVCGDDQEWLVLVVGTDYRDAQYLYGLADAIRIVRVDFTEPNINVVALPRALLIENPGPRLDVDAPILLNQAYLFGTSGMGHFSGSGYGAGALAETLQKNFGLDFDHYLVLDFAAFKNFIYMIGGVEIDLAEAIYINENENDSEEAYFPAGVQTLNGEDALRFARARAYTSDNIRIDNQTLLLKAIFTRLQNPEVLNYLPELINNLQNMILTDASLLDLQTAACLVDKLDSADINFHNPDSNLIETGSVFIPTMNKEMDIFNWDQDLVDWVQTSLWPLE